MSRGIALVQMRVLGLDGQVEALGHCVARADSKVQDNVLELIGIGIRPPQGPSKHDFQLNVSTKRMSQNRTCRKQLVDFGRLGMEGLLTGLRARNREQSQRKVKSQSASSLFRQRGSQGAIMTASVDPP